MDVEVRNLVAEGYAAASLFHQLHADAVVDSAISDVHKAKICMKLAEAEAKLVDGADDLLQLLDVTAFIQREICW